MQAKIKKILYIFTFIFSKFTFTVNFILLHIMKTGEDSLKS